MLSILAEEFLRFDCAICAHFSGGVFGGLLDAAGGNAAQFAGFLLWKTCCPLPKTNKQTNSPSLDKS